MYHLLQQPAVMSQISDFVKLLDSRDITELQLNNSIASRNKETERFATATSRAPSCDAAPCQHVFLSQLPHISAPASASPAVSPLALPHPAKANKWSHPRLKCPMDGTFYRFRAPGNHHLLRMKLPCGAKKIVPSGCRDMIGHVAAGGGIEKLMLKARNAYQI